MNHKIFRLLGHFRVTPGSWIDTSCFQFLMSWWLKVVPRRKAVPGPINWSLHKKQRRILEMKCRISLDSDYSSNVWRSSTGKPLCYTDSCHKCCEIYWQNPHGQIKWPIAISVSMPLLKSKQNLLKFWVVVSHTIVVRALNNRTTATNILVIQLSNSIWQLGMRLLAHSGLSKCQLLIQVCVDYLKWHF